jgi:ElaA protein
MDHPDYQIYDKPFTELTPHELYSIMRLRNEVFVVEQNCVYQDADGKDPFCHHLLIWDNTTLVAYTRLLPKGLSYDSYMSIGRVVSAPSHRKKGIGRLLMQVSIEACYRLFGREAIRIGAQLYLKKFYESLGFLQTGDRYLEDNIEHIEMTKES